VDYDPKYNSFIDVPVNCAQLMPQAMQVFRAGANVTGAFQT